MDPSCQLQAESVVSYCSSFFARTSSGKNYLRPHEYYQAKHLDTAVLAEAVASSLADAGKEFSHAAILAMTLILDTASCIVGSKQKVVPCM